MTDPPAWPAARSALMVRELDRRQVRWVMSGSTVAAIYGAALVPNDLDVVPAPDEEDLQRLAGLLDALDAVPAPCRRR